MIYIDSNSEIIFSNVAHLPNDNHHPNIEYSEKFFYVYWNLITELEFQKLNDSLSLGYDRMTSDNEHTCIIAIYFSPFEAGSWFCVGFYTINHQTSNNWICSSILNNNTVKSHSVLFSINSNSFENNLFNSAFSDE